MNIIIIIIISSIRRADRSCFCCIDRKNSIKINSIGIICDKKLIALRGVLNLWFTRPTLYVI